MKDAIIIDSTLPFKNNSLDFLFQKIIPDSTSLDIIFDKIKDMPFEKIVILPHTNNNNIEKIKSLCNKRKIEFVTVKNQVKNNADLYKELSLLIKEKNIENVILFYLDSPLIDIKMINRLFELHKTNLSEYTFGDNFVEGLVPEIMSKDFINKITEYEYKKPEILSRRVFDCINADINKFFIELEIAEYDFSLLRIELTASNKRNFILMKDLLDYTNVNDDYTTFYRVIREHPEILFIHPKYVEIEITNDCNLSCTFCPREKMDRKIEHMNLDLYKKIIIGLTEQYDDIIISFTLMGEPLMHP